MPTLREVQAAFAAGVLDLVGAGRIAGAIAGHGIMPERRLAIYRNNVLASLRGLLERTFPATRHLLGPERFAGIALAFVRTAPPERPQLVAYGAGFSDFLGRRAEAVAAAHVADVAKLEWAREEACYAADATPLAPATLAMIPIERYPELRFSLHPTVRLIRSAGPVYSLWQAGRTGAADGPRAAAADGGLEQVLVGRPDMTVTTRPLGAADLVLLEALGSGLPLAEAAARAQTADAGFDLQGALASHLRGGTFAACG